MALSQKKLQLVTFIIRRRVHKLCVAYTYGCNFEKVKECAYIYRGDDDPIGMVFSFMRQMQNSRMTCRRVSQIIVVIRYIVECEIDLADGWLFVADVDPRENLSFFVRAVKMISLKHIPTQKLESIKTFGIDYFIPARTMGRVVEKPLSVASHHFLNYNFEVDSGRPMLWLK
jgi:hypothetical protein